MTRLWRYGSYVWTSAAAGWFVLGYVTGLEVCYVVGLACCGTAFVWLSLAGWSK